MLHTGLAILFGYSTLHAEKKEEYNFADMVVYSMLTPEDKEEIEEIISQSDFVESYEKYYPVDVKIKCKDKELGELLLHSGILSLEKILYS